MSASNGQQTLILHEIYESIQGEGLYTGVPTIFIRLQGCPLRCTWCDSKYTWDFGIPEVVRPDGATYIIPNHSGEQSIDEICRYLKEQWPKTKFVCVTGGEPLAQVGTVALLNALAELRYRVTVETSGAYPIPMGLVHNMVEWVCDFKCPDSGMSGFRHDVQVENLYKLRTCDQLKFVISSEEDYRYAQRVIRDYVDFTKHLPLPNVLLSPTWGGTGGQTIEPRQLVEWFLAEPIPHARIAMQVHKVVWPVQMRGV